jgi:hypothetical protein
MLLTVSRNFHAQFDEFFIQFRLLLVALSLFVSDSISSLTKTFHTL